MKHAFLILAYDNVGLLDLLIKKMDCRDFDLFLHVDSKTDFDMNAIHCDKSRLFYVNRDDIRWGDVSTIKKVIEMMELCLSKEKYDYIHLLSDSDLPVKSNEYIKAYFSKNKGKEFLGFASPKAGELYTKVGLYHLFPRQFKSQNVLMKTIRYSFNKIQRLIGSTRQDISKIRKGPLWFSITSNLCKYIVDRKAFILSKYQHSFCADEIFLQTECYNSPFKANVFDLQDEWNGSLRFITWKNNVILPITDNDIKKAFCSSAIFMRKFNCDDSDMLKIYSQEYELFCSSFKKDNV